MSMNEAEGHFVAGFISGEGSFFVSMQRSPAHELGVSVTCGFSLKVQAADRELADLVQRAFDGAGSLYEIPPPRSRAVTGEADQRTVVVTLLIRKLSDLTGRVIPFFDSYPLRGQQRETYDLWKSVVQLLARGGHLTPAGLETVMAIKARMKGI